MRSLRRRLRGDDRGAFLVLWAIALAALVGTAALAIDLGNLRSGGRSDQALADLAALAAGQEMSAATPNYLGACEAAIEYFVTNANDPALSSIDPASFCTEPGNDVTKTVCSGGSIAEAEPSVSIPPFTVSIHFPVPESEISSSVYGTGLADGTPCQRLRVIVTKSEPAFFGAGGGYHGLAATRSATLRAVPGANQDVPALWLLDPFGCTSLAVSGGSQVTVGNSTDAGFVSVDSDGTQCSSNQYTVSSSGTGSLLDAANSTTTSGVISLQALPPGATSCSAPACYAADVSGGRLVPQPTTQPVRATRALVDDRFACGIRTINYYGLVINETCTSRPDYLDSLVSTIGASGAPPGGFQQWTGTYSCNPKSSIVAAGNWWVDCPGGLKVGSGVSVDFTNGNVVLDGGISMSSGSVSFNSAGNPEGSVPSSCEPPLITSYAGCTGYSSLNQSFVVVRSGGITTTGGQLSFSHAMVYENACAISMSGSALPPSWLAPTEGPFAGLALWSDDSASYTVNGGAAMSLDGIFFTPGASPLKLTGGGDWGQVDAQLITRQLQVGGGAVIDMSPDPTTSIALSQADGELIR